MKKVISLILVVLMSVCLLASCGEQPVDEFETPDSTVVVESEEVSSEEQNEQEQIPGYTGVLNPITGLACGILGAPGLATLLLLQTVAV